MLKKIIILTLCLFIFSACGHQGVEPDGENEPKDGEQTSERCGLENCHGYKDISCGPNVPDFCTEMYAIGDFCRQYAICEIINDECQMVPNKKFEQCRSCVEKCEIFSDIEAFDCEAACRENLK